MFVQWVTLIRYIKPLASHYTSYEVRVNCQGDHLRVDERDADGVVAEQQAALAAELVELVDDGLDGEVVADAALLARARHDAGRPHDGQPVLGVARELLVQVAHDGLLVLVEQARLHEVLQRGEALLDARADHAEHHRQAQAHVPHYRPPHHAPALVLAVDVGADEDGDGVGPGDAHVLVPPALHHDAHVEPQHERQWDQVVEGFAVLRYVLEDLFLVLVEPEAVGEVEDVVQQQEDHQVWPHQLVDAAPPS